MRIVSQHEFSQMMSYKRYAENQSQQQKEKKRLRELVQESIGDKYYRLKEGTKQAIDMMCWFAAERGFVFAGDDYLADRHDISDRTVRNVAKELRKLGLIVTIYRKSTKHNGRGCPIHLFVDHPYFEFWTSYFDLHFQADFQAEKPEIPSESKDEKQKNISTYNLTKRSLLNNKRKQSNNKLDAKYVPSNVPKAFVESVRPFFNDAKEIYRLWGKTRLAHQICGLERPLEELEDITIQAFNETVFAYKQNRVKKAFTGYFFGTLRGMFMVERRRECLAGHNRPTYLYDFLEG
ncbi:helix-turn-helix domain-containing protein [Metabacillus niabensis]|uniref:helix-turn-helix domain-containing protein n=1 Tax=Metabacillus niabensis TaxID=324854 RepID=UPI001CF9921A|nr:helix-turn-helix domain-containing protein [Metabacillus niabensis]